MFQSWEILMLELEATNAGCGWRSSLKVYVCVAGNNSNPYSFERDRKSGLQYLVINDQAPSGVIDFCYTYNSAAVPSLRLVIV
jgi:hypothetical protein